MCGPRGLPARPITCSTTTTTARSPTSRPGAGVTDKKGLYGFGVAWFDMDDDGKLDLLVANDSGPNYVYRNLGNGTFEDISYASGAALDGNGRDQAHMGIAIGDYDNDGRDDVHITNFADDFNVLYHNAGGASFNDVSFRAGVAQPSIPFLGWGTSFLDYDNDGWLDLLVVNGHVYPQVDRMDWNTSYAQRALLLPEPGHSRFEDVGAAAGPGLTTPRVARGSAVADFDNDGGIDIVVNNIDARAGAAAERRHRPRALADAAPRRRSGAQVPARRDRIGGVRHRGRPTDARRGRQRPRTDLAVGPARALRPGRRDGRRRARGALGERPHGALRPRQGGHAHYCRPEKWQGHVRTVTNRLQAPGLRLRAGQGPGDPRPTQRDVVCAQRPSHPEPPGAHSPRLKTQRPTPNAQHLTPKAQGPNAQRPRPEARGPSPTPLP